MFAAFGYFQIFGIIGLSWLKQQQTEEQTLIYVKACQWLKQRLKVKVILYFMCQGLVTPSGF
jgi:hypothetical protein